MVGRRTIFQYFLVKSDLCSLRRFSLRRSKKDAEYQNNARFCALTVFKIENVICIKFFYLNSICIFGVFLGYVYLH